MKYKHKHTGQVVTKGTDGLFHSQQGGYTLQRWIFENSNDWEEVLIENTFSRDVFNSKELMYTTADGHQIFKGDSIKLFTISKELLTVYEPVHVGYFVKTDKATAERLLCFVTEENRDKYIEENKPKYSLKEIESCYPSPTNSPLFTTFMANLKKLGK